MKNLKNYLNRIVPITTGRINPLHSKHKEEVFHNLLLNSSFVEDYEGEVRKNSPYKRVPFVFIAGTSNPDRNKVNNPFSFDQRVEMGMITVEELLREGSIPLTEGLQKKLSETSNIDWLIDRKAAFAKHCDNSERNNPPKLDSLATFIENHCKEHGIDMQELFFRATVKPGELGREYQLFGKRYCDVHQIVAVGQHYGAKYEQDLIEDRPNQKMVSATEIRHNLVRNFELLSPKVFQYIQKELALALLNNREIGDDKSNDRATDVGEFVSRLAKEGKMLAFNGGFSEVVTVPEEMRDSFDSYRIQASRPYTRLGSAKQHQLDAKSNTKDNTGIV